MEYIILDLEWNGAYSKQAHGYFNEIIEIGAVKYDISMTPVGTFHRVIQPVVSKKLSQIVKDLTHITQEELESDGASFDEVMASLASFVGDDAAFLTWSNTDLLVLMENFTFFKGKPQIPFMRYYVDIQPFCQRQMGVDTSQQMGLSRACEQLGISAEDSALHRALDDSLLTAHVFERLYDADAFADCVRVADTAFYERILYKPVILNDVDNPLIKRSDLSFACPECGKNLHRKSKWSFRSRHFCADFTCRSCKKSFVGRVQYKQTYDGIEVRRRIKEKERSIKPDSSAEKPDENSV